MIQKDQLANGFAVNVNIIQRQADGLTHTDSLLQPPVRGNCLNWVVGHIAVNRDRVLRVLGEEPLLTAAETAVYETGSEPLTEESEGAVRLERLLEILETGQGLIDAAFQHVSPETLAAEQGAGEQTVTVAQRLFGLYFHETYHTGQTELLRQLAGTDDRIIG